MDEVALGREVVADGVPDATADGAESELPLVVKSGVPVSCRYRNKCLVVAADGMHIQVTTDGIDEGAQDGEVAVDGIPEAVADGIAHGGH